MSRYRRLYVTGGTYFFTLVTHERRPIFSDSEARTLLRRAFDETGKRRPFEIIAMCLLPDHLHTIWTLPDGDANYGRRWGQVKGLFSRQYVDTTACGKPHPTQSLSRTERGLKPVWQKRFWEHVIRDEDDLKRHIDYIHYNPVKHGLVTRVADWPHSTFHRYVRAGILDPTWGAGVIEGANTLSTTGE